jgi:hypothetical protein
MAKFEKVASMTRLANPLLLLVRSIVPMIMSSPGLRGSLASRFPIFATSSAPDIVENLVKELSDPSSPYWSLISAILVNKNITSTVPFKKQQFDPKAYAEILSTPGVASYGMAQADMPDLAAGGYGGPGGTMLLSESKKFVKVAQEKKTDENEKLNQIRSEVTQILPKDISLEKFQSDINRILTANIDDRTKKQMFEKYISSVSSKLDSFHRFVVNQGFVKPV